jgi:thymidylate synthase ThyX
MKAEYIPLQKRAGDLCVVNSARVSFSKMNDRIMLHGDPDLPKGQGGDDRLINFLARHDHWSPFAHAQMCFRMRFNTMDYVRWGKADGAQGLRLIPSVEEDTVYISGSLYGFARNLNLLPSDAQQYVCSYLHRKYPLSAKALSVPEVENTHSTATVSITCSATAARSEYLSNNTKAGSIHTHTLKITAPIFVARQLGKHQVDLVWNEESRRYIDHAPTYFYPERWKARPEGSIKQGAGDVVGTHDELDQWVGEKGLSISETITSCDELYHRLKDELNIAPEQARMVLPQNMNVSWWWTGTESAFKRVIEQRVTKPGAQAENSDVVNQIAQQIEENGGFQA